MHGIGRSWRRWAQRLVGRGGAAPIEDASPRAARVSAAELEQALHGECPPVLVDIRGSEAFAAGHLPGAVSVPASDLERAAERLERAAPMVVY